MQKKYHLSEIPLPQGFRIYFDRVPIMGVAMRKADAIAFCKAQGGELVVKHEPGNPHDKNALKLIGSWKGWFRKKSAHLGYVPADIAAKLADAGLVHVVRPRLMKTYLGTNDFVEIEFQIIGPSEHYDQLRPRKASPAEMPTPQENAREDEAAIARLDALMAFLKEAPRLSPVEVDKLWTARSENVITRMLENGETSGEASGVPAFLNLPESDFRDHLRSIDNDLSAQIEIVDTACRAYFETGELPAPYYPWRIAVILSKRKMKNREREFLTAWCRHFASGPGRRYAEIVQRAKKVGAVVDDS
ncbi:HIRAN domain-containing protein [Neoaquamicrobium sediminum]|uniref:HIRAN domain-containing protein n=1 Tax=Neoaquamicrobium sediminum TaxID=1849104 RepID=UPI003BA9102E